MIIDGIEYEDEPGFTDPETGKPVYYAKNVPDLLRGEIKLSPMKLRYAEALDTMIPLDRASRGRLGWNLWVKAKYDRWCSAEEKRGHLYVQLKPVKGNAWDDGFFQKNGLDFSTGQTLDDTGHYSIEIVDFNKFVFPCVVSFNKATFSEGAWFEGATFSGEASFSGATFSDVAWFEGATFSEVAWFEGATFSGEASFEGAAFSGRASIYGATFSGGASFDGATFSGGAWFDGATFSGGAWFDGATFSGAVSYYRAVFFGEVRWYDSEFTKTLNMAQSLFLGEASFENARIKANANFDHASFGKTKETTLPDLSGYGAWHEDIIQKFAAAPVVDANSITIPNFKGAIFEVAPNLGYTNVPDIPAPKWVWAWIKQKLMGRLLSRFWQQNVPDQNNMPPYAIKDGDAAAKLRVLGALAARGHHHLAEKRFFRAELLARRGWETKNGYEVAMINAFEKLSKCGLSFWWPMRWLMGVVAVSALFYASQIDWPAGDSGVFELASYSIANSLPLLGYISDSYEVSVNVLFGGIEKVPGWVRVWAFMQNAVSAILIFFGLLAIRNYFKLG